jgi:hypothetical protein|tara:strand:- start:4729 stop:4845 length:117 start_codon:yes stop_codon:yes gene_type:complete
MLFFVRCLKIGKEQDLLNYLKWFSIKVKQEPIEQIKNT